MSQTVIIIWSALLPSVTAACAVILIAWYYRQKKFSKILSARQEELDRLGKEIGDKVEDITRRETKLFNRGADEYKASKLDEEHRVYSWVGFSESQVASLGEKINYIAKKKLAQRIGYVLLNKYRTEIREVKPEAQFARQFRIDFLVKPYNPEIK